jgi:hypothetical protein
MSQEASEGVGLGFWPDELDERGGVEICACHELRQAFLALGLERFGDRPRAEAGRGGKDATTPRGNY